MKAANDNTIGDAVRAWLKKHPEIARQHHRTNLKWLNEKLKGF